MHNFLHPALLPKVYSTSPSSDGYEPTNLISEDFKSKFKGFLAYYTLRPPIDVVFDTICPISVRYIKIRTRVEQQVSSGIEILAKNGEEDNVSISKSFFSEEGVIVCDSKYYSNNKPPCPLENYKLIFFKSYQHRVFTNTDRITIRILQTIRSVPCLGLVEIWGIVSKSCSKTTIDSINKLQNPTNLNQEKDTNEALRKSICDNKNFVIPEEFKDAITYEVMALPYTLPSGNTIDKSTLDKCVANDETYGRQPSDPFTGVTFTAFRKPAPNTALKTRIDMFLVKNKNQVETFNVPRTTGKRAINVAYAVSAPKKCKIDTTMTSEARSLDDVIADVFKSNNFIRFTSEEVVSENKIECVQCKIDENLYSLPCKHYCCRKCLTNFCLTLRCKCGNSFIRKNVTKYLT